MRKSLVYFLLVFVSSSLVADIDLSHGFETDIQTFDSVNSLEKIEKIENKVTTYHSINLSESFSVTANEPQNKNVPTSKNIISNKQINLSENFSVSHDKSTKELVRDVKARSDRLGLLERIFPKELTFENIQPLFSFSAVDTLSTDSDNLAANFDLDNLIFLTDLNIFENNLNVNENIFNKLLLDRTSSEIGNLELSLPTNNSQFNLVNEYIFLLLVPTIGFIFIKSEIKKIDFKKSRTFFSVFLILTFSLSTVSTPFLISNSYWGYAYGEELSSEEIIQDPQNDIDLVDTITTDILDTNVITTDPGKSSSAGKPTDPGKSSSAGKPTDPGKSSSAEKPTEPVTNPTTTDILDTTVITTEPVTNPTTTDILDTNVITTESVTNPTTTDILDTNVITTETVTNSTSSLGTNSTSSLGTNSTSTELIDTNSTSTELIDTNSTSTELIDTNSTSTELIDTNSTSSLGTN